MELTLRSILCATLMSLSLSAQMPNVEEGALRAHLAFLADDVLEGRGTGQRGGELAVRYLETQLQVLGLQSANGACFRQRVQLAGVRLDASQSGLRFEGPKGALVPELGPELALGAASAEAALKVDAPLVFVGHGTTAPDGSRELCSDRPAQTP